MIDIEISATSVVFEKCSARDVKLLSRSRMKNYGDFTDSINPSYDDSIFPL